MSEPTIKERLIAYRQCLFDLDKFYEQKDAFIKRIGSIRSVNFSADKVTVGNHKRLSDEERYVLYLEKINNKINEYENTLEAGKKDIDKYIDRLPRFEYREIIRQYYFWRCEWWQVAEHLFISDPHLYIEGAKRGTQESINPNFLRQVFNWRNKAFNELEKLYNTPYIPATQQMHIDFKTEEEQNV